VGLGNVNNTTDANKPISTLTQTALDTKLEDIIAGSSNVTIDRTEPLKPTITVSTDIAWGSITGTLSSQTDLDTALGGKVSIQQTVADEGKSLVVDSTGKLALKILDTLEFYGPYDAIADLPLTPNLNGIYLVGTASPYSMYIYTNNQWLAAGSTDIDLSSYVTKTELENVVTNLTTIVAAEETAKEDKLALDGDANTFSYMQSQNLLKITNSSTAQTPTSVAAGGIITFNCIPVGLASHMKADKAIFTTVANSGGTDYDIVVDFSLGGTVVETYKLWDSTTQTLTDFDLSSLNVYILTLDGEWDAQTDVSSFGTFQIRFPLYVNRAPILPYVGTTDSIPVAKNDGTYIWVSSGNFGKKYTQTFTLPNNYEITINHNLGTKFIINNIYELAGEEVSASVTVLNDNSIKLEFSSDTPTGSQYNIVIMG
jgi:hypothetical protein